jgi:pyruvate dehydrogenase E2 component (dihydrolipoamide acetyltransferase)
MVNLVVMPKLGLTMKQGKIIKWFKQEGQRVEAGEKLFEVATDKLTNEIEAAESGIVRKLLAAPGESVACLKPIAIIGGAEEDISGLLPPEGGAGISEAAPKAETKRAAVQAAEVIPKEPLHTGRIVASPAAKKLARERGADLAYIKGTGPKGRIRLKDVELHHGVQVPKATPMAVKTAQTMGINLQEVQSLDRITKQDVVLHYEKQLSKTAADPIETRQAMSQMRKVIAERMSDSWHTSPAVTYDIEVDMTQLQKLKDQLKEEKKLTYTDFLIKLVSEALLEFPLLNASVEGEEIIIRNYVNMGVAVAVENGLVVPVIPYANTKGLRVISEQVKELSYKAKANLLSSDEMTGGTFTITNLGMYGIHSFSPIINQPEVAILGVNAIRETPIFENGSVVSKPIMKLSLTADHRVADGAVAAQFLHRIKQYIEKPGMLLL